MTKKIETLAYKIGFHKVRFTDATQPTKSKLLKKWLQSKYHGKMHWMDTRKLLRMNINKLFPDIKSVICVAHNYFTDIQRSNNLDTAKISRYAWGSDYHKILKKKLKILFKNIQQLDPTISGRILVDTAPIMEKLWAEKAGIGWQGKHTNLITREFGSWVFLGEIIINKQLSYHHPIKDFCGTCIRCIQACPTGAIIKPYVLDSNKCIAYLTIEFWDEPIPQNFKSKFDNYIFGCDICQEVCPWNKFQTETEEKNYFPKIENINPLLSTLNNFDKDKFIARFKDSPISRLGWKNFQRNVKFAKIKK